VTSEKTRGWREPMRYVCVVAVLLSASQVLQPVDAATRAKPKKRSVASVSEQDGLRVFLGAVKERDVPKNANGKDLPATVQSANAFTLNLYRGIAASKQHANKNVVLGPYTALFALGMTYGGARAKTAEEMASVLGAQTIGADRWHTALNLYDLTLAKRLAGTRVEWRTANKIWVQRGIAIAAGYADLLTAKYGAPLGEADFAANADTERKTINDWTSQSTKDRIPDLFAPGSIDQSTKLVLVNAVSLDAPWEFPFPRTATGSFTTAARKVVQTPMMFFDDFLPSATTAEYQVVEIPYSGGTLVMDVIVPNNFSTFETSLTPKKLKDVFASITDGGIHLSMPKFKVRSHADLVPALRSLGMRSAFGAADFSGITGGPNGLNIGAVEHEAFIDVDENGTKAAAASGVEMMSSHGPTVTVDRPFFYVIRDKSAGMILFVGRVVDPTQAS
jgi:serpin B